MKLLANLANLDRKATSQCGISPATLMEHAGAAIAKCVQAHMPSASKGVILCGPGNNGGDGFVCARLLLDSGFQNLTVIYTKTHYRNEALQNLEQLMLRPIALLYAPDKEAIAQNQIAEADFIVDALFGSGLNRPIQGIEATLIQAVNTAHQGNSSPAKQPLGGAASAKPWVISVDLPSGIDSESGQILGQAINADFTLTLAVAKPGLYLYPGKAHAGTVHVADIGIPKPLVDAEESTSYLLTESMARHWLPLRNPDSYKGNYGHVLVIAGSEAMPGAAILCSEAAMKAGAGLVTIAAPDGVFQQCPLMPEIMRFPLGASPHLTHASTEKLRHALQSGRYTTLLIGPGLGREAETVSALQEFLQYVKQQTACSVILDADGLYALSATPMPLNDRFILTPHIGECARLLEAVTPNPTGNPPTSPISLPSRTSIPTPFSKEHALLSDGSSQGIKAHLLKAARTVREYYQAHVVLKSATTVIASQGTDVSGEEACWISSVGNPGMATAGSGDVLAGIIAAQVAQATQTNKQQKDINRSIAVRLGVYLHGLSGDVAAEALTPYCLHASDITRHLPDAFKVLMHPPETQSKRQTAHAHSKESTLS